jgi:endonuclease YncB( thermonuclease family)
VLTEQLTLVPWTISDVRRLSFARWLVEAGHISDYAQDDPRRGEVAIERVRARLRRRIQASCR